jgi:hypothetical protein
MKSFLLSAALLFLFAFPALANGPALPAPEAATIAQADLTSRGLESTIYIAQIIYKKESLMGGAAYWEVMWSKEVPAQTEGRKEIGLRISMDGSYKRAVR